ncbi:hypothetical protein [Staphylococcus delphini]|uniref:Uncharacterized protein n=1 Tax=Staphylococcus delphini TaxID=53344 RepID=A0AAQ0DAF8_9STAP|nr:hypothetical protein [Staphylococcus delphini]QUM68224.1 hypothetical protein IPU21_01205 [Staphylococcus delphini]QUM70648.1 hypothetical protein IPU22_01195 [Staphylococcus delphini]
MQILKQRQYQRIKPMLPHQNQQVVFLHLNQSRCPLQIQNQHQHLSLIQDQYQHQHQLQTLLKLNPKTANQTKMKQANLQVINPKASQQKKTLKSRHNNSIKQVQSYKIFRVLLLTVVRIIAMIQ